MRLEYFKVDLAQDGLEMIFKEYQIQVMRLLWKNSKTYYISRKVWDEVNKRMDKHISRASVINFLNAMVDAGVLQYEEESGKGGYRRKYKPLPGMTTETEFLVQFVYHAHSKMKLM